MKFTMVHTNLNVLDLEKSLTFYKEALGMQEVRRKEAADGSFILVFMQSDHSDYMLELTWLRDKTEPYELGDNETHIAFITDEYESAHKKHGEMGVICFENTEMGLYFIEDPNGYWFEIIPQNR